MKLSKYVTTLGVTITLITAQMFGLPNSKPQKAQAQTAGCGSGSSVYLLQIASPIASNQFRVACDEHDTCYDTFGKSKEECDKAFHNRMLGICSSDHNTWLGKPLKIACNGRADAYYSGVKNHGHDAYRNAQPVASQDRFRSGFYSHVGMNPPGIIYRWPSPWNGGTTDVWCDVPNHNMYVKHINNIGSAIEVNDLGSVRNTANYWSKPCTDDVFEHPRVQH